MSYDSLNPILRIRLNDLFQYISNVQITEFRINKPFIVITDTRGSGLLEIQDKNLSIDNLKNLCKILSNMNGLIFNNESPQISCVLPFYNHRFEAAFGASAVHGISLAIRCKHKFEPSWQELGINPKTQAFITTRIQAQDNIVIAGATNTGKTTLLNKLLSLLPDSRRVVSVEDTPEVDITRFWNGTGLIAGRGAQFHHNGLLSWEVLSNHINRITPDNIIFGEISTANSFCAINSLNAGNKGFMCTIHAESPKQVPLKFAMNLQWGEHKIDNIAQNINQLTDLIIQIKRNDNGFRQISDLFNPKTQQYIMQNGVFHD